MLWSHLGNFGDQKGQKLNIFLKSGCKVGAGCGSACLPFGVSTGAGVPGSLCYFADVSNIGQNTAECSAFCLLFRLALGAMLANMALFRFFRGFLEGFMGFVWVCVVLVLCVACGAFVRVWS